MEAVYGLAWAACEDNFRSVQVNMALAKGISAKIVGKEGAALDYVSQAFETSAFVNKYYHRDITP